MAVDSSSGLYGSKRPAISPPPIPDSSGLATCMGLGVQGVLVV